MSSFKRTFKCTFKRTFKHTISCSTSMHFKKFAVQLYHAALACTLIKSKCVFHKRGLIPKNSISGNTLYFYVEKIVFSPQWGKMSFTGGIIEKIRKYEKKRKKNYMHHCNIAQ